MQQHSTLIIAGAIIIAGLIIAAAVFFAGSPSRGGARAAEQGMPAQQDGDVESSALARNVREVQAEDHVLGSADATLTIIEYSDFECPFCASHHPTLARIVSEFNGDVAWVYRHLPLTSIHAEALPAALASECAGELGGNSVFWSYADGLFVNQDRLGRALYDELAQEQGLDAAAFSACLDEERHLARVEADMENAAAAGGQGTPFNIIVREGKDPIAFAGAVPYAGLAQMVRDMLAE